MDGIEDEVVLLVRARVPGNDLSAAADDHLSHVAFYQYVPVSVGHRRRVVIGLVPDQVSFSGIYDPVERGIFANYIPV